MSDRFRVARLSEMELPDSSSARSWWAIRSHFDIGSFGINAWTASEAGAEVINDHDEVDTSHEELAKGGERFLELAPTDTDLDPIREESRFKELVG